MRILDIFQWRKFLYKWKTSLHIWLHCLRIWEKKFFFRLFLEGIIWFFSLRSIITLIYYEKRPALQQFYSHETARINLFHSKNTTWLFSHMLIFFYCERNTSHDWSYSWSISPYSNDRKCCFKYFCSIMSSIIYISFCKP